MGGQAWNWPFGARAGAWRRRGRRVRGLPPWRALEPWADAAEAFPGAAALGDVGRAPATTAVAVAAGAAARLAVIQLALGAASSRVRGALLEMERAAAAGYVRVACVSPRETAALGLAVRLAGPEAAPALAGALCEAAAEAAAAGFGGSAASLLRAAYRLAAAHRWEAEAACAAEGMLRLARAGGGRRSAVLWSRRAQRHRRALAA